MLPYGLVSQLEEFLSYPAFSTRDQHVGVEKTDFMVFSTCYPLGQKATQEADQKGSCLRILTFIGMLGFSLSQTMNRSGRQGEEDPDRRWEEEGVITLMVLTSFPTQDSSPWGLPAFYLLKALHEPKVGVSGSLFGQKEPMSPALLRPRRLPVSGAAESPLPARHRAGGYRQTSEVHRVLGWTRVAGPTGAWRELHLPADTRFLGGPDRSSLLPVSFIYGGEKRGPGQRRDLSKTTENSLVAEPYLPTPAQGSLHDNHVSVHCR